MLTTSIPPLIKRLQFKFQVGRSELHEDRHPDAPTNISLQNQRIYMRIDLPCVSDTIGAPLEGVNACEN